MSRVCNNLQAIVVISFLAVCVPARAEVKVQHRSIAAVQPQYKVWNITQKEWNRYQSIMRSTGKFLWKNKDPITVLGLNARSVQERNRFAKLLAIREHKKIRAEILLSRAFRTQTMKLYGHKIIDLSKLGGLPLQNTPVTNGPHFGDRYILFINTHCTECDAVVKNVRDNLGIGVSLDLEFKNDTRQEIVTWAKKQNITPSVVRSKRITLNPESSLYKKYKNPAVPALYLYDKKNNRVTQVSNVEDL